MDRSLTTRVIVLSIFWIFIALGVTAWLLGALYRAHVADHFDTHVRTHVEELLVAVETKPSGQVALNWQPTDPQFHRLQSGWYWQIMHGDEVLKKSHSLDDQQLDLSDIRLNENPGAQIIQGPNGHTLRAQTADVSYAHQPGTVTIVVTAPEVQISDDVKDFLAHVTLSFLVLGIGLSVAVVVQVRVALKPLKAIRNAISDVRAGKTERLPREFPSDVQPLANELNYLLDHNELLLKRARNQLADLAHAVKNPLTVIRNAARNMATPDGQLVLDQSHVMANSIDHSLTRARMYGRHDAIGYRTSIKPIIRDLCFAVEQIYRDRNIELRLDGLEDQCFRGEAQDLEEMAGNLIDNGCKWARSIVTVSCSTSGDRLELVVEDDGLGIEKDGIDTALQRGSRLDESQPGSGQGLGIVTDIAENYGGSLRLGKGSLGGLQAVLNLPAA